MAGDTAAGASYGGPVAWIYIFNLIVGVGSLNLPSGFAAAGLIQGCIFLGIMGFLAFITVTWIIEVLAAGNALLSLEKSGKSEIHPEEETYRRTVIYDDKTPLIQNTDHETMLGEESRFQIKDRIELGMLARLFLGDIGQKIYLYGDLSIYAVIVSNSLTEFIPLGSLTQDEAYYIWLTIFTLCMVPLTFFNFQKTKYLQYGTLATRNIALFMMIIFAIVFLCKGEGAPKESVPWFTPQGTPNMFGVGIYAFMCHHSLPSLVTPIKNKSRLTLLLAGVFLSIGIVYVTLCSTAVAAFGNTGIQGLYNNNFRHVNWMSDGLANVVGGFLALFPVFTLTSNFPLIAITLRNNLTILFPSMKGSFGKQIQLSLIATIPPIALSYVCGMRRTDAAKILIAVTGSYPGLCIMFIIPAALVYAARRRMKSVLPGEKNPHSSPFAHLFFVIAIMVACLVALGFIIYNQIQLAQGKSTGGH
ncbi:transmembrane protein [Planoprotostelium fungivorum]|uniref:Transmembrane protein n=1 Tax=Planoprotostelium fungivorum TaxID=1890364 RepID=A0A2P6NK72_9EUKA|nr:transmembrane protein [Planoprotostelium fungivorum]